MRHLVLLSAALFAVALAAAPATEGLLPAGTWELSTVNGEAPQWEDLDIFIIVANDGASVSGKAGCNSFSGRATELADNVVSLGNLASTMMMCIGDGMDAERFFFDLFGNSLTVDASGEELTFTHEDTTVTYVRGEDR